MNGEVKFVCFFLGGRGEGREVMVDVNREMKFFCENSKKKNWGRGGGGVRMDVNEELKFL